MIFRNQSYSRKMPVIMLLVMPFYNPEMTVSYNQLPSHQA